MTTIYLSASQKHKYIIKLIKSFNRFNATIFIFALNLIVCGFMILLSTGVEIGKRFLMRRIFEED